MCGNNCVPAAVALEHAILLSISAFASCDELHTTLLVIRDTVLLHCQGYQLSKTY
jgi:hypothetical protein